MLRLLPDVCRDCGVSAKSAELSPYLDFLLCADCIRARERALFSDLPRRAPKVEAVPKKTKPKTKTTKKPKTKQGGAAKPRKPKRPAKKR